MAVKDCIKLLRKAGHKVELADRRAIKKYVDSGMTDEQAVKRLILDASADVLGVVEQVIEAGGEVETGTGQLAEVRSFRIEKLRALMGERSEFVAEIKALDAEYRLLIQESNLFDEVLSQGIGQDVSFTELDANQAKMMFAQLLMRATTTELPTGLPGQDPNRIWPEDRFRTAMERNTLTVQGSTADEIYASRQALETRLAQNRKQKQLAQQAKLETQAKITAGFKPETTQLFQGPTDEDFQEFEGAQVSTDQGRIAAMLGPHLYGDQDKMGDVTVKELFQNSFDAVRAAIEKGQIEDGQVNITLSNEGRTISIQDNGVGMTSDMIRDGLLTIGGTGKEGSVNSGGFGIAKMLFLFGAEEINVITVRDGVKSTFRSTGAAILANAKDPSQPLDPNADADKAIRREETDEANGTRVEVTIPENYTDQNTGKEVSIGRLWTHNIRDNFSGQLLHPNVSVNVDGRDIKAGANFDKDQYDSVGTIQFQWGSADILVTKQSQTSHGTNMKILNNGLIQFEASVSENPFKLFSPNLPFEFVIDLHPSGEPGTASYPFELNRQSLRGHANKDLERIKKYFVARYREDKFADAAVGYGKLTSIDVNGKTTEINIAPVVPQDATAGLAATIDPNATIEVVDGVLTVDGEELTEITEEELEKLSFDVSKYKIDQSAVPPDQTLIHNQSSFKEDSFAFPDKLVDGQAEAMNVGGRDVNDVLYEIFGEERVNGYFNDIGSVLVRMKDLIAEIGDDRFNDLKETGAGVSILGSKFYGVHTVIPAKMIFVNPGADPHDLDSAHPRETMTREQRMQLIASSMMTTMIHEIAHHAEMNHDSGFMFAMESVFALLDNTPDIMGEFREIMRTTLDKNYDIYQFIEGQFQADALEVVGPSLKDVGQVEAGDDVRAPDDAEQLDEDGARPRDAGADRPSDRPIGGELDDESISAGARPDGIVVPPGTVHPLAGQGAELLKLYHGSPFNFDEFDMAKVGTGEGAQAYGWGLYFAESQEVGKAYVPRDFDVEEMMLAAYKQAEVAEDYIAMEMWEDAMMHWTPDEIRNHFNVADFDQEVAAKARTVANVLENLMEQAEGQLYEVEISAEDDAKMLNQDAGLEGQPQFIQDLINERFTPEEAQTFIDNVETLADASLTESITEGKPTPKTDSWQQAYGSIDYAYAKFIAEPNFNGSDFYSHLKYSMVVRGGITQAVKEQGAAEQASMYLLEELGVPGMKFLDQASRTSPVATGGGFIAPLVDAITGEGPTSNVILFSTDSIASVTRNGEQVFDGAAEQIEGTTPAQRQANLDSFMYDSVVVNEDGTPKVVYHGTQSTEPFNEFIPQRSFGAWNNLGTWFSSENVHAEKMAKGYLPETSGQIFPVFLSIRHPFEGTWEELQAHIDRAIEMHNANTGDTMDKRDQPSEATGPSPVGVMLREYFIDQGYDGIVIKDWLGDFEPMQDVFVAFDSNQIKSAIGNEGTFDIEDPNILKQDERGRITFNEGRKGFIEILASGDASTFIHETGHMYLEVMKWAAQQDTAPDSLIEDWEKIKAYTGATDETISKEAHEKFANSFEIYTLEGKAPSLALQDSFNAFRRWLLTIYAKIKNIGGVHLNDEIRGVFDRMLASDKEIALAEQSQGFVALFADAETAGMSQEQFDHYSKQLMRTHDEAVEKETRRMLMAMTRDQKAWWRDEREKVKLEVEAEAHLMRVYIARAMLQKGKQPDGSETRGLAFKIDKKSLMRLLGDDQQSLSALPRPFIYTLKGGVDVDIAAKRLGYKSGIEMIDEIGNAAKMEDFIEAETEVRMRQRYPDPLIDGTLADNALKAAHSEGRLRILSTELRELRRLEREDRAAIRAKEKGEKREDREAREANKGQIPKRAEMAMLKAGARSKVETMQIRHIKPHVYLRAEQKAGREAFEALERRDYAKAYAAKLTQIINHEMYRASLAVQKEMESTRNFIARFEGPRKQRQLGKAGVLNQVLAVLEGIELRKVSLAQVDRDNALKELKQAVLDGRMVVTPATFNKIMDESINWQEFTPEELRGMKDVLKQIEHGAVNEDKMMVNDELVDYSEAEDELAMSIVENGEEVPLRPGGVKTSGERANNNIDQGIMTWLRPSSIARVLDKSGFGAVTRRIIAPMRRAYAEKLIPMLHKAQRDVADVYRKHYTAAELGKMSTRLYDIEALGETYSKSELLSMALNWGNQGNRDAVLGGTYEGSTVFSEQAVKQMLAHLTAKDWAFVQDIWDYNDTYREAAFDAEERRRGIRPEQVEALPFEIRTADGQTILVRGGYHPLRYDRAFDPESGKKPSAERAAENIEAQMQHLAVGGFVTANTKAGSTYARVKNHGRVVRLGLNIIDSHLREVIRDIAIGDEVMYIKRLLESGAVQRAMIDTNNAAALEALDLWLTDSAVGELPSENIWEFGAAWIRTGFTKAKLGWNFTVMFLQFTGLFQTIAVIGTAAFGRGLGKFMQNPAAAMRHVTEVSQFIKTRYEVGAFDKDVQDTKALVESEFGNMPTRWKTAYHVVGSTLFSGIAAAQKVVDVVTWLGAYEKGLNEESLMLSEADAIIYADTQVEAAQTSGFFSDRSGLERGTTGLKKNRQSQFIRIWTTLISYMLAKSNIAYEKHKDTDYKDPKQVSQLFFDLIMLYTVEGMASAWLYGRLPDDDDEPEDWALWAAAATGESAISGVPFVREIAAARFGGGNTPIGVFSNDALRMIDQIAQGENDWALWDATADVLGTAAHLPTGQISKTGKTLWEEGLDGELYEYFTGPRD